MRPGEGKLNKEIMSRATLVATVSSLSYTDEPRNGVEWKASDWLEVRADLMPELDPAALRSVFRGSLLYSLRSCRSGGNEPSSLSDRCRRLRRAAHLYDLVDLEGDQDLSPALLNSISPHRRVISWYGRADHQFLQELLQVFSRTAARLYRFEISCSNVEEGIIALQFLYQTQRADVTAYATGPCGVWTRILAPRVGAPIVFAGVGDGFRDKSNAPTVLELIQDYGLPDIQPVNQIFGIVGEPVSGSLSPRLHNAAHRACRADRVFLSFPTRDFDRFWSQLVLGGDLETMGFAIKGLTVVSPNKQSALQVSGYVGRLCQQCKATNLLVNESDIWTARTTDPEGIFHHAVVRRTNLSGTRVAVVGCGGSGRVAAAALVQRGAEVTLVNRSSERGEWAAHLLGLRFVPLKQFSPRGYSAMINATPVGQSGDELPISLKKLNPGSLIVDLAYKRKGQTPLVAASQNLGHKVIEGRSVLLAQTMRQYGLMTGTRMPEGLAREMLGIPTTHDPLDGVLFSKADKCTREG
jgi:3-dehydroquinate dehydratase / shikimate dehydrogenase